jgi:hypothetical protein
MKNIVALSITLISFSSIASTSSDAKNVLLNELAKCHVAYEISRNLEKADEIKIALKKHTKNSNFNKIINAEFNHQRTSEINPNAVIRKHCLDSKSKIATLNISE